MPRGPKGEKRHADTVQNAMLIGRIATGEVEDTTSKAPNRAKGGKIGRCLSLKFLQDPHQPIHVGRENRR